MPTGTRTRNEKVDTTRLTRGVLDDARLSRNGKFVGTTMVHVGEGRPFHRPERELLRLMSMTRPTFVRARRELERLGHLWLERRDHFIVRYVMVPRGGGQE